MKKILVLFAFCAISVSLYAKQQIFIEEKKSFPWASVKNIEVETQNIEVEVYPVKGDTNIVLKQTPDGKTVLNANLNNGNLKVSLTEDRKCSRKCPAKLVLYIANPDTLSITTKNESIEIDGVNVPVITLNSAKGDMDLENVTCKTVTAKSKSGDIDFDNLTCNITAHTYSGEIDLENITGDIDVLTVKGDISIENVSGAIKAETKSGDIKTRMTDTSKASLNTLKGKISVK